MNTNVEVLQPSGILNNVRGNQLRDEVNEILTAGIDIVLIDLKDVKFIDSSGLGALVAAMKMVQTAGGKIFFCSINDQVRMLFELTQLSRILEKFADRDEFNRQVLGTL